jgi:hypothetical protein
VHDLVDCLGECPSEATSLVRSALGWGVQVMSLFQGYLYYTITYMLQGAGFNSMHEDRGCAKARDDRRSDRASEPHRGNPCIDYYVPTTYR